MIPTVKKSKYLSRYSKFIQVSYFTEYTYKHNIDLNMEIKMNVMR